jgi:hypothetical protein
MENYPENKPGDNTSAGFESKRFIADSGSTFR